MVLLEGCPGRWKYFMHNETNFINDIASLEVVNGFVKFSQYVLAVYVSCYLSFL